MRLADGVATFEMVGHHPREETARECVESYLRAWEIDAALRVGCAQIAFEFDRADVIDRDPPPPGTVQVVCPRPVVLTLKLPTVTLHFTQSWYPEPPRAFVVSPDVETMWGRYEAYLEGRESLAAMAYSCLDLLQTSAGGQEKAAKQYGISRQVLSQLGRLTSEVGDERTARKFKRLRQRRPHTGAERAWIEAAVKALTLRAGEWAFDPGASRPQITMSDLPKL